MFESARRFLKLPDLDRSVAVAEIACSDDGRIMV
jgi:hypothetical protein